MSVIVHRLDKYLYPNHSRNWDDLLFRERICAHLEPAMTILDLGAGAGIVESMNFKGVVARVCGVDLDPRVVDNPMLDEGRVADAGGIPYPEQAFDLVFADNVVEHLADPLGVFQEVYRILKPGGLFLFKTPNKTHYVPTIARLTPHYFHQFVNRIRGRSVEDTFPTLYRANTRSDVHSVCGKAGFTVLSVSRIEGRPEYLRMTWPTYLLGAAYERMVSASELFAALRVLLIAELRKT